MKSRPRSVENQVAEALSLHFAQLALPPVERIPVLGRTGPDISLNALGLVVDVKSRVEVPKTLFFPLAWPFHFDDFVAVRLADLPLLWRETASVPLDFSSRVIAKWWQHMQRWTETECPDGVSALVLHRPKAPIGGAVVVIHQKDRRRLYERTICSHGHAGHVVHGDHGFPPQ